MIKPLKPLFVLLAMLGLSACSLPPSDVPVERIYVLQVPPLPAAPQARPEHLVIRISYVSPPLDSQNLLVMPDANRFDHIANVAWPAPLPVHLRDRLIRSLLDSGSFASVGTGPVAGETNRLLEVQLYEFQASYRQDVAAPECRIRLGVRIAGLNGNRDRGFALLTARHQAADNTVQGIVTAFDQALAELAGQLQARLLAGDQAQN